MSHDSLLTDFRKANLGGKLRRLGLGALAVAVVIASALTIRAILRLHFHDVAESLELEARLEQSESAAAERASTEHARSEHAAQAAAERAAAGETGDFPFPYEIRGMAVPIANHRQNQALYAQFTIVLDCPSPSAKEMMALSRAKIRSRLYEVAMRFSEDDFRSKEGFERFRHQIESELKDSFGDHAPRTVALRDWMLE